MNVQEEFKSIASLIGEPVRALILWNLLDGRAFTATEIAIRADVSPQSASMHLSRLQKANLLVVEKQGRHRYFRFSRPEVAYAIEAMANLLDLEPNEEKDHHSDIRFCRTCYDHLAGKVGVALTDQMIKKEILKVDGKGYSVTGKGIKWFTTLGIEVESLRNERRAFARQCLDWSERRHHLAGALASALLSKFLSLGWIRKPEGSRVVYITSKGQKGFYDILRFSV